MDVAISELRAHISDWLELARSGGDVVITERGVPVARLIGLDSTSTLERLVADGIVGRPASTHRPTAAGRTRPRPRPRHPLSDLVSEQRR